MPKIWLQNVKTVKKKSQEVKETQQRGCYGYTKSFAHLSGQTCSVTILLTVRVSCKRVAERSVRGPFPSPCSMSAKSGSQLKKLSNVYFAVGTGNNAFYLRQDTTGLSDTFPGGLEPMKFSSGAIIFPKRGDIKDLAFILPCWGLAVVTDAVLTP